MSVTTKDPMTKFRSVIRGKNSKGGDRFQLYLTSEEAAILVETITANLGNERGVKVDLHVSRKIAQDTGREFDSAICFVKPVSDGPGARGAAPKSFVAKPKPNEAEREAKIANLKKPQIG
jgi:hypothetical protein